jgi:uncharacterized protein YuzE
MSTPTQPLTVKIDREANALYVTLDAARMVASTTEVNSSVNVDYDSGGVIVGIEILDLDFTAVSAPQGDTLQEVAIGLADGMARIAGLLGLDVEAGEVGPIVERVQALVRQGDTADVIERAAAIIHKNVCNCGLSGGLSAESHEIARELAAAGLLAASPAPESLDLDALAGVCRAYVSAWDDRHADATVLGSLARRVALAASPAAPQPTHAEIRAAILGPNGREPLTAAVAATRVQYLLRQPAPAPADDEAAPKHQAEMVTIPKAHLASGDDSGRASLRPEGGMVTDDVTPHPEDQPVCDTCGQRAVWSEIHGWLHAPANHPFGLPRAMDPVKHEATTTEWMAAYGQPAAHPVSQGTEDSPDWRARIGVALARSSWEFDEGRSPTKLRRFANAIEAAIVSPLVEQLRQARADRDELATQNATLLDDHNATTTMLVRCGYRPLSVTASMEDRVSRAIAEAEKRRLVWQHEAERLRIVESDLETRTRELTEARAHGRLVQDEADRLSEEYARADGETTLALWLLAESAWKLGQSEESRFRWAEEAAEAETRNPQPELITVEDGFSGCTNVDPAWCACSDDGMPTCDRCSVSVEPGQRVYILSAPSFPWLSARHSEQEVEITWWHADCDDRAAAPVEAETPAPKRPCEQCGQLDFGACDDCPARRPMPPNRDEVVEEFADTRDGVDRTPLPARPKVTLDELAMTPHERDQFHREAGEEYGRVDELERALGDAGNFIIPGVDRYSPRRLESLRHQLASHLRGEDQIPMASPGTGTEADDRPLWRERDRVTWTDEAGTYLGTVAMDEQPPNYVTVKYDGIALAGAVQGDRLMRITEAPDNEESTDGE